jgi:hypothetical protein
MYEGRREFLFIFCLLGPSRFGRILCCALYMTQRPSQTILWRYTSEVITATSRNTKELLFLLPTPFFCSDMDKNSYQALPNMWGGAKKHSQELNSSFTVFTFKWNHRQHPKSSKSVWSKCSVTVVLYNVFSPAVLPKPFNLEDYSRLQRIDS